MFFEDAHVGSKELDIVLTSRDKGNKDSVLCAVFPSCGRHLHHRLLEKGYKVAVCEQVEDPRSPKDCQKDVIRVLPGSCDRLRSPGTGDNNYLMVSVLRRGLWSCLPDYRPENARPSKLQVRVFPQRGAPERTQGNRGLKAFQHTRAPKDSARSSRMK